MHLVCLKLISAYQNHILTTFLLSMFAGHGLLPVRLSALASGMEDDSTM